MFRMILMAALVAAPAAAQAQSGQSAQPGQAAQRQGRAQGEEMVQAPKRIRNILLFGQESCPESKDPDEIVVCSKAGDSPYRIPEKFRERAFNPANQPWTRRVEVVEEVNKQTLPNSCSAIGINGQTGCSRQALDQWRAERQAQAAADAGVP